MDKPSQEKPANNRNLIHIGWVILSDIPSREEMASYVQAGELAAQHIKRQFPEFQWQWQIVRKPRYPAYGMLDPLDLLESGVQEKIKNHWDFAVVLVSNELKARYRIATLGVPSSALEVGVLSGHELVGDPDKSRKLAGLALHILGHLWGLEHSAEGVMAPPEHASQLRPESFSDDERLAVVRRLEEVSDVRVEERNSGQGMFRFYWNTFRADPRSLLVDVIGYAPWRLPLKMGRMTAATVVSMLFMVLSPEPWQLGIDLDGVALAAGTLLSIVCATVFIFAGQKLGQVTRELGFREQVARTRMVTFLTLFLGLFSLWLMLFIVMSAVALGFPREIVGGWLGGDVRLDTADAFRYAAFMAVLGIVAGAVGGNIEEEAEIKADLFFDEEV